MVRPLAWVLGAANLAHLLLVWGEVSLAHPTAHTSLAVWEMTRGRYRAHFRISVMLSLIGVFAPLLGTAAVPAALAGLFLYEHAYVQAGQSVPLA